MPFQKGQSGNPGGRPARSWTMTGLIEEALEMQDVSGTPYKKTVAKRLVDMAQRGDLGAIKEINQRLDGMPTQKVEGDIETKILIEMDDQPV